MAPKHHTSSYEQWADIGWFSDRMLEPSCGSLDEKGAHAYAIVVHGPDGVGKRTVCHGWTYQLLGGFDTFDAMIDALNDDHPVIRHIMNGTHPALYTVPCPASIKDVRRVLGQLGQTAWSVAMQKKRVSCPLPR